MEGDTTLHVTGLTPTELADELGCTIRQVRRRTSTWPHHKIGGRIRFTPDDVEHIRKLWIVPINQQNGGRRKAS